MLNKLNILDETLRRIQVLYEVSYERDGWTPGTLMKVGLKQGWNVVIGSSGQCGMAMSFTGWDDAFGKPKIDVSRLQTFIGKSLFDVASEYINSDSWQERSIGVAALSALSQPLITPEAAVKRGFEVVEESLDFASSLRPDDIAAVIGYGGGVKRLIGRCKELHVTDMRPRQAFQTMLITKKSVDFVPGEVYVHPEKENQEVLGRATAVSITGSALVNGTFEELLSYSKKARLISVYGASAGFIPDVLFERGVHMIHASRITDPAAFERGMLNDMNMEPVMQSTQKQQTIRRR
jgi:uncharacterized protein (DUF4213/DUF364 family)